MRTSLSLALAFAVASMIFGGCTTDGGGDVQDDRGISERGPGAGGSGDDAGASTPGPGDGDPGDVAPGDAGTGDAGDAGSKCPDCAPHEQLLDELVGFGEGTTGGLGGSVYTVTSLANSGAGTLREGLTRSEPTWVRFGVSGTITLSSPINITANTTLDGRGADVTITGNGLYVTGVSNVIINNVKIRDTSDDAIRVYNGAKRVWVHHVDISNGGDGAIDVTEGVTDVTVSWNHIFNHDKAMLIGAGSDDGDGAGLRWTAHHNWYDRAWQRLPMLRMGKAHSFNNLVEWINGTAMDARVAPAQLFSENDILAPQTGVDKKVVSIGSGASVKFKGTWAKPYSAATLDIKQANPDKVFDPSAFYSYTAEVADAKLEARIRQGAGWQNVPFPE